MGTKRGKDLGVMGGSKVIEGKSESASLCRG